MTPYHEADGIRLFLGALDKPLLTPATRPGVEGQNLFIPMLSPFNCLRAQFTKPQPHHGLTFGPPFISLQSQGDFRLPCLETQMGEDFCQEPGGLCASNCPFLQAHLSVLPIGDFPPASISFVQEVGYLGCDLGQSDDLKVVGVFADTLAEPAGISLDCNMAIGINDACKVRSQAVTHRNNSIPKGKRNVNRAVLG